MFLALLVGFRHLALTFVTFIILARGLGALGGYAAKLSGQSERRGVLAVLLIIVGLLCLGVWGSIHAGSKYVQQLQALLTLVWSAWFLGEPVTPGYLTAGGFVSAQDDQGWYDTGDLGYLTENGEIVVCGRLKDVIIMAGRNIYPTDIERAAGRVRGVRPGCAVAVRLDAGHSRESFAVVVESKTHDDPDDVRRIEREVAHEVVAEVDVRPRPVVVLAPGAIPKTPSGKLRRAHALTLVG